MSGTTPDARTPERLLADAVAAVRRGGEIVNSNFLHVDPGRVTQKNGGVGQGEWNPVSEIDRAAETAITELIAARYPGDAFLGEENIAGQETAAEHLWIVDPIDGTSNYIHGMPHFGVSVGYAHHGEVIAAACYDPQRDELFTATRGGGAALNGHPIHVSSPTSLGEALVCTGFYYDRGAIMERTLAAINALFRTGIHGIRRTGSAVLDICWQAAGRYDAFFEYQLSPWDFLPPALIATEAGATVSTTEGTPLGVDSGTAVCCSPGIHSELLDLLRSV
ncbi:MAG: inositol monophosphatase family protein [Spirochaeta sp.]|jgi:myo-inositol-1(or 4)-monophosphatase|nr:inositol monophosphatase family protein [Spirochaeta sp.]